MLVSNQNPCAQAFVSNVQEEKPAKNSFILFPCGHLTDEADAKQYLNKYCPCDNCPERVEGFSSSLALKKYLERAAPFAVTPVKKEIAPPKPYLRCIERWQEGYDPCTRTMTFGISDHLFLNQVTFQYYDWPHSSEGKPFINTKWLCMYLEFNKNFIFTEEQKKEWSQHGYFNSSKPPYRFSTGDPNTIGFTEQKDLWQTCFKYGLGFLNQHARLPEYEEGILKKLFQEITGQSLL